MGQQHLSGRFGARDLGNSGMSGGTKGLNRGLVLVVAGERELSRMVNIIGSPIWSVGLMRIGSWVLCFTVVNADSF